MAPVHLPQVALQLDHVDHCISHGLVLQFSLLFDGPSQSLGRIPCWIKERKIVEILLFWMKKENRNGILLPKLFWPTVRKNCSSDRKTFEIRGWRPRICKIFQITRTIYSNSEMSEQFLVTEHCKYIYLQNYRG